MTTVEAFQDLATTLAYSGTAGGKQGSISPAAAINVVKLVRTGADALRAHGLTDEQVAAQVPALAARAVEFLAQLAA